MGCPGARQNNLNPRRLLKPNPLHAKWESAHGNRNDLDHHRGLVILLEVWAIWHIIGSERRAERKMLWVVFVVYAPFPGLLFWAWRGPRAVKGRAVLQEK